MPLYMFDTLSPQTEHAILSLLATAMPGVIHLGIMGGMPGLVSNLFRYFKKICSIEQLVAQPADGSQEMRGSGWFRMQHGAVLSRHVNSTVLCMLIWESMPFALTALSCHVLQMKDRNRLCWSLRSLHLTSKQTFDMQPLARLDILELCNLLEDAPYLRSISTASASQNTFFGAMCSHSQLTGMQTLHQRIVAGGLMLGNARGGVPVMCTFNAYGNDPTQETISLSQLLCSLPSFHEFLVCRLSLQYDEPPGGCMLNLARVFPCMETLVLKGHWKLAELLLLSDCTSLHKLVLSWNPFVSMGDFVQVALNMPWLKRFILHGY